MNGLFVICYEFLKIENFSLTIAVVLRVQNAVKP